jgi:hypothetical protein
MTVPPQLPTVTARHRNPVVRRAIVALFAVSVPLLLCHAARAQTVTINPSKDNTLHEQTVGTLSNGEGPLFAGRIADGAGERRRAAIDFEVAGAIPAGSTILSAELRLQMTKAPRAGAGPSESTMTLHRLLGDWGEGSSAATDGRGDAAETGDATWTHSFFNTTLWSAPGGDFLPGASASTLVGDDEGTYVWGSTASMVADVQAWLDSPANAFGWLLIGDETTFGTARRFDAGEARIDPLVPTTTVAYMAPQLVVTYAVPEPALGALAPAGLLLLARRRTSRAAAACDRNTRTIIRWRRPR